MHRLGRRTGGWLGWVHDNAARGCDPCPLSPVADWPADVLKVRNQLHIYPCASHQQFAAVTITPSPSRLVNRRRPPPLLVPAVTTALQLQVQEQETAGRGLLPEGQGTEAGPHGGPPRRRRRPPHGRGLLRCVRRPRRQGRR